MSDDRIDLDADDALLARMVAALRPLPRVNDEAKARVLVAVAAEREAARTQRRRVRRAPRMWAALAVTLSAAAVLVILARPDWRPASPLARQAAPVASVSAPLPAALAALDANAEPAPVAVELMLNAPAARRVRVVGDFTGWEATGVEMRRDAASGLWSATAIVRPGRHVYAFIVDDSVWLRDPRAPIAPDSDFGRPGSLLVVGRP